MISDNSLWKYNESKNALIWSDSPDILQEYLNLFTSIFPNLSLEPNTPQYQICSYLAQLDSVTIKDFSHFANYFFNGGSGEMLDMWAWNMFRAKRKNEVLGYVNILIQGIPGTTIPSGFIVSDGTQKFITQNSVIIGGNGSVEVLAVQTELSTDIALQNTITDQITPIVGIESVTNPSSSTAGIPKETDTEFYNRCIFYNSLYKNGSYRSIMANLSQIKGVTKISGFENPTSENQTFKNQAFTPHSFGVVVLGGSDKEIAEMIKICKPLGCDTNGNVEYEFIDEFGNVLKYRFFRPENTALSFEITPKINDKSPSDWRDMIYDGLNLYIANLEIGATITQPQISKFILDYIVGFEIDDIKIGLKGGTLGYSPINLSFTQNATISQDDITINI